MMLARVVVRMLLAVIVHAARVIVLTSKSRSSQLATGKNNTQSQVTCESGSEAKMTP